MNIEYKIGLATQKQLYNLLLSCDNFFIPKLSEKVNIEKYSEKLFTRAVNFEAWENDNVIGLISMYVNDEKISFGYITNVSVENKYLNKGIASKLLKNCIEYAKIKKLRCIKLEVNRNNISALKLYEKFNYKVYQDDNSSKFMQLDLNQGVI